MRPKFLAIVALVLLSSSCEDAIDSPSTSGSNPTNPETNDPLPSGGLKHGAFTSYEHNLKGSVTLHLDTLNGTFIRLEEFTMLQGPDVRVYVSKSNNYSKANTIEIAMLKDSYLDRNIDIPIANYSDAHKFVLVYCLEFHALFGYAELE